jgi:hypothetical protein
LSYFYCSYKFFLVIIRGNAGYYIKGQKVITILSAYLNRGEFIVYWNGRDETGSLIASGEYIARLKFNDEIKAVHKIILIK